MGTRFKSSSPEHQRYEDAVELVPVTSCPSLTASYVGGEFELPQTPSLLFILDADGIATDAIDTLDVYIQTRISEGTLDGLPVWVDVVHFTQVLGNGGAMQYVGSLVNLLGVAEFETATALGAAAVRNLWGDKWRARWDVVDADTNSNFMFAVGVTPMG